MGISLPTKERSGEGQFFCFVISKWHILVNSEVLNLKFFFIVSSLSEVRVDSVENFGFSKKASLNAVIWQGRLILVCYIRKYVIILVGIFPLTSPPTKILVGMSPWYPRRVDASDNNNNNNNSKYVSHKYTVQVKKTPTHMFVYVFDNYSPIFKMSLLLHSAGNLQYIENTSL